MNTPPFRSFGASLILWLKWISLYSHNIGHLCRKLLLKSNAASPWSCKHEAHSYCFQIRALHSSSASCPSCEINVTEPLVPFLPSRAAQVLTKNDHYQLAEFSCICGFQGSLPWFRNMAVTTCPNCHRPVQSGEASLAQAWHSHPPRNIVAHSCGYLGAGGVMMHRRELTSSTKNPRSSQLNEPEGSGPMVIYNMQRGQYPKTLVGSCRYYTEYYI